MELREKLFVVLFATMGFLIPAGIAVYANSSQVSILGSDSLSTIPDTTSDVVFIHAEEPAQPFEITINATGVSLNIFVPGYGYMGVGAVSTFDFDPGIYSFTDSAGANLPSFEVTTGGVLTYALELDDVVYTGLGTSTLSILGFPITVDASGLSVGVRIPGASTSWIIDPVTHYLPAMMQNPYNFWISNGGGA